LTSNRTIKCDGLPNNSRAECAEGSSMNYPILAVLRRSGSLKLVSDIEVIIFRPSMNRQEMGGSMAVMEPVLGHWLESL